MTISSIVAPRPPNSFGQSSPTYPASHIVFCHARSRRTSSRSAREAANARPRRSSGRFASSQARTSLRNASSRSVKSKFIGRRGLRPPLDSPAYTRGGRANSLGGASLHDHAAVDVEGLAGDVARFVGGEEDGGPTDDLVRLLALHRAAIGHALVEHLARRHALERRVGLGDVRGQLLPE